MFLKTLPQSLLLSSAIWLSFFSFFMRSARAIDSFKEKALFLTYTSSGLRRKEILGFTFDDVDFQNRMIKSDVHKRETKKS